MNGILGVPGQYNLPLVCHAPMPHKNKGIKLNLYNHALVPFEWNTPIDNELNKVIDKVDRAIVLTRPILFVMPNQANKNMCDAIHKLSTLAICNSLVTLQDRLCKQKLAMY